MATTSGTAAPTEQQENAGQLPKINWGWFLLRGLLAIALGIVSLLFPVSALFTFTMFFAAYAFVDGVASVVSGIKGARNKQERWWALILRGLVGILVGALFLLVPILSTITYAYISLATIAAWSILTGVLEITAAIRLRKEIKSEWLLGLSGLLSILLGLGIPLILMSDPLATILSVAWMIGIFAFAAGIVLVVQAIRLRGKAKAA
ncbi:HdeD family acid-resistance protein [Sphingomonas olei]